MGFLSTLGKIGKVAGKGALGFATGGPVGAAIGVGGGIAGEIAKGREDRRDVEGGQQFQYDVARNRQTLDSEQAMMDAERRRARQMIALDLLGSQSGPSDPRGQKFMSKGMIDPATLERLRGSAFKTTPDISMPQFAALPKAGKTDKFLNILGGVGAFTDAMGKLKKPEDQWEEIHGTYGNAGY